jgi:protein arginine N-methyltransferase 1
MYSIGGYGRMIADQVRMDAYAEALRRTVRPSSVVLDIGTGTGIFALLACRLGARRVFAIEPDDSIQVARAIAAANGCADRIEFIQDLSTRVTLPERADVIVSDLRNVLPPFRHHLPAIADARQRLLAPGGTLIPQRDTVWAVPVEAPEPYGRLTGGYQNNPYGFNLDAALRHATNVWCKARVTRAQLLAEPQCWATLNYTAVADADLAADLAWGVVRPGVCHGVAAWFDAVLVEGVAFSGAPDLPELIYGHGFFPWSRPVAVAAADRVEIALKANLVGDDYVWRWDSRILHQGDPGQVKAHFQQSTFFAVPRSAGRLRKLAAGHAPRRNEDGGIDQFILGLMDGTTTLGDIAGRLMEHFPACFGRREEALTRAGEVAEKYGR